MSHLIKRIVVRILSINNFYNSFRPAEIKTNNQNGYASNPISKYSLKADIVSFAAKEYSIDDIVSPTNHCAYCGCKVYSQSQLESLAKEILQNKASRLEGHVKSVIEKLEGAKKAQDIEFAKKIENEEQIKFFKNFLDIASKKSYLKGEAIFEQVYHLDKDQAFAVLVKNLNPLLKTVDHISPQNEDKDNKNSDINLVEACYCCNHDLKKGAPFSEFYAIFPSIKNNMPSDKFNYALSSVLDSSQSTIAQRISSRGLIKLIDRLFLQRNETANNLRSIEYRIKDCSSSIQDSVEECRSEIAQKRSEASELQARLDELMKDPEYVAMLQRASLCDKLDSQNSLLDSLRSRRQRTSDAINELNNPKQNKKQKNQLSPEEKEAKLASLKESLTALNIQLSEQEDVVIATELAIAELDEKFPTIDILQQAKSQVEVISRANLAWRKEQAELNQKNKEKADLQAKEQELTAMIAGMSEISSDFDINSYTPEQKAVFDRYIALLEALNYIEEHPNGGALKSVIKESAKKSINEELSSITDIRVISDYILSKQKKDLESQLNKVKKELLDVQRAIDSCMQLSDSHKTATNGVSYDQAQEEISKYSEDIRRVTEKLNLVKIPQRITTIQHEITLLEDTIKELLKKSQEIDSAFNTTA